MNRRSFFTMLAGLFFVPKRKAVAGPFTFRCNFDDRAFQAALLRMKANGTCVSNRELFDAMNDARTRSVVICSADIHPKSKAIGCRVIGV